MKIDIVHAWKDEKYCWRLSSEEQILQPASRAGGLEGKMLK